MITPNLSKKMFKICEAVALGLKYYYMGPKDKRELTMDDYDLARMVLPQLPKGWMQEQYDWQVFGKSNKEKEA